MTEEQSPKRRRTLADTRRPYTCGSCAHFWARCGSNQGDCRCWRVKGKDGNYVRKRIHDAACPHYAPHEPNFDNIHSVKI